MTDRVQSTISARNARAARAGTIARPATAPAYYLGVPATAWLAASRHPMSRGTDASAGADGGQD